LLVDIDPHGNLTTHFGIDKLDIKCTIYDVMLNCKIEREYILDKKLRRI
jgi:chromosome partitioning protein